MASVLYIASGEVIPNINPTLQNKYEAIYPPLVWVWDPSANEITRWQRVGQLARLRIPALVPLTQGNLAKGGEYLVAVGRSMVDYLIEEEFCTRQEARVLITGLQPIKNDIDAGDYFEANEWLTANGAALRSSLANNALRLVYDEITAPIIFAAANWFDANGIPT
jgi:hypothetical protein